jgi:hypothetical protein
VADGILRIVVLRSTDSGLNLPDAFGCYVGRSEPIEVEEGRSWRDALADAHATINALEDALASLGYEAAYCETPDEAAEQDGVESLTVNDEPWALP